MSEDHGYDLGTIDTDWLDSEGIAEQEAEHSRIDWAERIAEWASITPSEALALVQNPTRPGGTVA